jgi:glycosyltransferase involved in cell wall biosynthesis
LRRWLNLYRTWFKEYLPLKRFSRAYLYKVNRVIAVGDYLAGELKKEFGLGSAHVSVIRNGIDLNLYQPSDSLREATRRKLGLKSEDQVLLCIGRLSEDKGFSLALNSFAAVADLYPNAKILFVGDGEQRGYLEGLASLHGLENRTIFTGRIQQSQTADYYASADVLLIPSLRYEGLPYTLIEAAAFGMAIITTCHGGQGAEITNGLNGLLIRPDNQKDCVKALHKLLSDPSAIRRLGRNARQTAEERYDVNKMVEAFEVVSYEVIENDRLRSHS